MFTGLIEATGHIERAEGDDNGRRLRIQTALGADLRDGDSIAVNGVCLTVTSRDAAGFTADLSRETLAVTSFRGVRAGLTVNLERPVRADSRMGGHFVLGHVDGTGRIASYRPDGQGYWLDIEIPRTLSDLVISRGSIAIDGISLTVASLSDRAVGVQVIPFTHAHTSLAGARPGDTVNVEVDVLGKYVARLIGGRDRAAVSASPLAVE